MNKLNEIFDQKAKDKFLGKRFSSLIITEIIPLDQTPEKKSGNKSRREVKVKCDCGIELRRSLRQINEGRVKSCGCKVIEASKSLKPKTLELVGKIIKGVKILDVLKEENQRSKYKCICICGKEFTTNTDGISLKYIPLCGCKKRKWGSRIQSDSCSFSQYKSGAYKRNLEFKLNIIQFTSIIKENCLYCTGRNSGSQNGIDRIDSNIGYAIGNVIPCCAVCNRGKNNMSIEDFLNWRNRFAKITLTLKDIKIEAEKYARF